MAGVSSRRWVAATIDSPPVNAPGNPFQALQIPIWNHSANLTSKPRFSRLCDMNWAALL